MLSRKRESFNVTDRDQRLSELFYKDEFSVNCLDEFKLNDISYGTALQINIFELLVDEEIRKTQATTQSFVTNIKVLARRRGFDQLFKLFASFFVRSKAFAFNGKQSPKIVFFAENFVQHILDDFIKIMAGIDEKGKILFISNDRRSTRYINSKIPQISILHIGLPNITVKQFLGAFKEARALQRLLKQKKSCLKDVFREYKSNQREIVATYKSNFFILPFYSQVLDSVISNVQPAKIVVGCDAFSLSRILIDQSRKKSIGTYVIQHGMMQGYNGFLPLYADNIFLWSQKEKAFFEQKGFSENKLLVTGSPRFAGAKKKISAAKERITITFISGDVYAAELEKSIDDIEAIADKLTIPFLFILRPHPHIRLLAKKIYNSRSYRLKNVELDSDSALAGILDNTDFAVVSNYSTTIFEISAKMIPLCIVESKKSDDLGINLYNFKRCSIDEIVSMIHSFYDTQFYQDQKDSLEKEMNTMVNQDNCLHATSVQNIIKYLVDG